MTATDQAPYGDLPDNAAKAPAMNTTLHDFLHHTTYHDLPDEVRSFARQWLLDLIGVAAGGRATSLSRIIHTHAARHFGVDGALSSLTGARSAPQAPRWLAA